MELKIANRIFYRQGTKYLLDGNLKGWTKEDFQNALNQHGIKAEVTIARSAKHNFYNQSASIIFATQNDEHIALIHFGE